MRAPSGEDTRQLKTEGNRSYTLCKRLHMYMSEHIITTTMNASLPRVGFRLRLPVKGHIMVILIL